MVATVAQKILARAAKRDSVLPGEIVYPEPDCIVMHDMHAHLFLRELWEMGLRELWHPERVLVVIDHRVPAMNAKQAAAQNEIRDWVRRFNIPHFYDVGASGIAHHLQIERGFA